MSDVETRPGRSQPARQDPRLYQIAVLAALLLYGMVWLGFDVGPERTMAILGTALATQYVCGRIWGLPAFDPKSALISGLSLCLLCRANEPLLAMATAVASIASKFTLRWRSKHVFSWLLACRSSAPPASSLTPRSAWASPRAASSPGPCPAPSPFLGGRSREEIETLLTAHHLANVTSDPLLDFVAAQEARMVAEGREPTKRRRYVVWGDVPG